VAVTDFLVIVAREYSRRTGQAISAGQWGFRGGNPDWHLSRNGLMYPIFVTHHLLLLR